MYHVKEAQLLSLLLLEQLPQLHIDGIDYTDLSQPVQQHTIMPQFLRSMRRFETRMIEKMNFTSRISRWEAARAVTWLCTSAATDLDGTDFSLREEADRKRAGIA